MKNFSLRALTALALLFTSALAQTHTDCDPMNSTCPPDQALGVSNYTINFQDSIMSSRVWNQTAGSIVWGTDGAEFVINAQGDAPTVKSNFYLFFGQVEVIMKAASGQGIVSSIVLLSDDLDEIDWEMIGGNDTHIQTNYFGKGNQTAYNHAIWYPVNQVQQEWHNYTVDWSKEKIDWYIDSQIVRTLLYEEATASGINYFPQTPCNVRLGIWAGGDPKNPNGTIQWAGGLTDYKDAPFTMTVQSVRVSDASNATQYVYGDRSGSYQSIELKSTAPALKLDGTNSGSAAQNATQKWKSLSTTAKIGIGCSVAGVFLVAILVFSFCCIKQRRAGKHEKLLEDAKFEKERAELMAYRSQMGRLRNEKLASVQNQGQAIPMMGNAGATFGNMNYSTRSVNNDVYSNNGYAYSMSSMNSGRGYQRY